MKHDSQRVLLPVLLIAFGGFGSQPIAAAELPDCPGHIGSLELPMDCICTKEARRIRPFNIQGCEVYAWWSNICMAAVHAGVTTRDGGPIRIEQQEPKSEYIGCLRNNMFSNDMHNSDLPSFVIVPIEDN
ncbi:LCCL domain-containing protein [Ruegeria hyattellae]|jgi:hypothetical protein|uniref:LCCL domain-containing protein n=1 Tax=Ruegeria hyattellae TaxID=3233337 RepID=UPI00355C095A